MFKVRIPVTSSTLTIKDLTMVARFQHNLSLADIYLWVNCKGFEDAPEKIRDIAQSYYLSPEEVSKLKIKGHKNKFIDIPIDKDQDSSLSFYEECQRIYKLLSTYPGYYQRIVKGYENLYTGKLSEIERKAKMPNDLSIDDLHADNVLSLRGENQAKQFVCIPFIQVLDDLI